MTEIHSCWLSGHSLLRAAVLSSVLIGVSARGYSQSSDVCVKVVLNLAEAAELLRIEEASLAELAALRQVPGRRIGNDWRFNCASLLAWVDGAESLPDERAASGPGTSSSLTGSDLAGVTGAGALQAEDGTQEIDTIGEAPEERTAEDIFLRGQRVLLAPGQAVLDFGAFFSELNSAPLASIDGQTVLTTIEQETFLTSIQARVGFRNETELFVATSYFSQDAEAFFGNEKIANASESDLGAVGLGLRRTLKREGTGSPNIIGSLATRIPTDDGPYALSGSLAFVKSVDPVVLFSSIAYTHVFDQEESDILGLQPSDRVDVAAGYALALNDTLALSMSLSGTFTASERLGNFSLRQRDSYAVRFGMTSRIARGVYIEPSVSFTLGGPDDGFAFALTVPYTLGRR